MAGSDDVDTKAAVSKYLSRQTTGVRLNADGDTAEENQAVLESIAISFLLNPQAALSLVLRAKNSLQQLIGCDVETIDYLVSAIGEISNPDLTVDDTSDLVEAQTALVELDRIGRVDTGLQAYTRYIEAVNRFLNDQLAPSLKRRGIGTFERSGTEAKTDLFNSLSLFTQIHGLVAQRTKELANAVTDYNSVDLTRVVSTTTLSRVRESITKIKSGMDQDSLSKATAAIELLSGTAALQSISNARELFDPSLETGIAPVGRDIQIGPEPTAAFILGNAAGPFQLSVGPAHKMRFTKGVTNYDVPLPITTRTGCPYLPARKADTGGTFNIPSGLKLYIRTTPGPTPGVDGTTHIDVSLPNGVAVTVAAVQTAINGAFPVGAGTCELLGTRLVLTGRTTDTQIEVAMAGPGSFGGGVWTPDDPSGHAILGFDQQLVGNPREFYPTQWLVDSVNELVPVVAADQIDGALRFTSLDTVPAMSAFSISSFPLDFGFSVPQTVQAIPLALELFENGLPLEPTALGLLVGSLVHAGAFVQVIKGFDGNRILFDPSVLLPLTLVDVLVEAPIVEAVRTLMAVASAFRTAFDADLIPLQQVLSPLLSQPTLAQTNDALRVFSTIRGKLTSLQGRLVSIALRDDQQPAAITASNILSSLEERGLDKAQDLLSQCLFSNFFGLDNQSASKSSQFLKTMEAVGQNELSTSTIEEDQPDGNLLQGANPDSLLTGKNVP